MWVRTESRGDKPAAIQSWAGSTGQRFSRSSEETVSFLTSDFSSSGLDKKRFPMLWATRPQDTDTQWEAPVWHSRQLLCPQCWQNMLDTAAEDMTAVSPATSSWRWAPVWPDTGFSWWKPMVALKVSCLGMNSPVYPRCPPKDGLPQAGMPTLTTYSLKLI